MPARNNQFRVVTKEFRVFLERQEAWPTFSALLFNLKAYHGGRRAEIVEMKRGCSVPQKYVKCLVEVLQATQVEGECLAARGTDVKLLREKLVLGEFLAARGIDNQRELTVDQIADLVAGPLCDRRDGGALDDDWQLKGINGLPEIFTDYIWKKMVHPETLCRHEEDIRLAVDMIMTTVGRDLNSGKNQRTENESIRIAERHMRTTRDNYLGRAIDLWRGAKWTFSFAVANRQRVGCACILPLKEIVYEELRGGRRSPLSCSAVDLTLPSRTLFIEAYGHKPDEEYPFFKRKTIQTIRVIYLQLAALSLDDGDRPSQDRPSLRLLSLAGNQLNKQRLKNAGFRATGTRIPEDQLEFMEMDAQKAWFTPLVVGKIRERLLETGQSL